MKQGEFLAAVVIETRCDEVPHQDTKRRPCMGGGGKASKRYTTERMHRTQDPLDGEWGWWWERSKMAFTEAKNKRKGGIRRRGR